MPKKQATARQHPDDFIVITLSLDLQAKLNPEAENPIPFEWIGNQYTMPASEAVGYLELVINAIRDRRLYGFMVQDVAEGAVDAGDWIKKTTAEIIADAKAETEAKNQ